MHFSDTLENALDENARERARFSLFQRLCGRISSDIVRFLFVWMYEWMNEWMQGIADDLRWSHANSDDDVDAADDDVESD